ncbi:MAG: DUF4185 domain-containing protein, partial [bacterium]|nr:DUF4185 domain-containing protein [bacterium]
MEAVRAGAGKPPYPRSKVIGSVEFEPVWGIACPALNSDNWPLTWADDGALYTSYGDGWGFKPLVEKKLSQGFARIRGWGEDFNGENIRSESGETLGGGENGAKASGMVMVDGILYAWTRNVGNAQLMWSQDRGKTWEWGFKLTESFGSPAFLNFGRNYAGARDEYVYTYSQAGPSAYEADDGLVLARVRKDRIRERAAYDFFVRLNGAGEPVWSKNIAERGLAFEKKNDVQRVDAVYNAGLGRYMLALGYGHRGGWGIFDAPEPWGPWTTVLYERWSVPGTGSQSHFFWNFSNKWLSADGRDFVMISTGTSDQDRWNSIEGSFVT